VQLLGGETWGYLSSIFFAVCGLPQTIECFKNGHSRGLNIWFLISWTLGEIFLVFYACVLNFAIPLFINAGMNLICLAVMLWYYWFPRERK
jgi:uncharacterized protein with PQ loop repeat